MNTKKPEEKMYKLIEKLDNLEAVLIQQKTVLTLNEVANYTGLSKSYLYHLTSTGGIPCYKPTGKIIYFNKNEIDKWLLSNRKSTRAEIEAQATSYILTVKSGGVK
ncbi:MAG: helix-turn-helix domain-containing protein [Clostridia bacterium]|nr:helix-turn-helix domain-containing protein [Clostridia bacterium]